MNDQLLVAILAHLEDLEEGFRSGGLDSRTDGHTARRSNVNVDLARALRRRLPGTPFPLDVLTEAYRLRAEPLAASRSVPAAPAPREAVCIHCGGALVEGPSATGWQHRDKVAGHWPDPAPATPVSDREAQG